MKLYTEKQVKEMLNKINAVLPKRASLLVYMVENITEYVTPIELPSDEEIEKRAESYCAEIFSTGMLHGASNNTRQGYIQSAKWMKEQILNQNK